VLSSFIHSARPAGHLATKPTGTTTHTRTLTRSHSTKTRLITSLIYLYCALIRGGHLLPPATGGCLAGCAASCSLDLVVGDDGADAPGGLARGGGVHHGGLAEDDLELAGAEAPLRHGLHVGGRGARQRAPLLEVPCGAPARHHVPPAPDHALRAGAPGVQVRRAPERRALAPAHRLRAHHGRHVEPVHQAHAVRRQVPALRVHRQLHHRRRRRGARLARGPRGAAAAAAAARARHHAARPEARREAQGDEPAPAAVQAARVVGDGREAGVRGHQRPYRVRAQVVERQRGGRRRRRRGCREEEEAEEEKLARRGRHGVFLVNFLSLLWSEVLVPGGD
jgi:hypothetical protein